MLFAVIGGTPLTTALDAVVALVVDDRVLCSGVLVGERHVLTAAHCVGTGVPTVVWGTDLLAGAPVARREVVGVAVAEGFVEGDRDRDLAVLELEGTAPARPWPIGEAAPDLGELTVAGFGVSAELADDEGVKRAATLELLAVEPGTLISFAPGVNACSGDSGGPAIVRGELGFWVAGVNTFVDPNCLGGKSGATRPDVHLDWLAGLVPDLSTEPIAGVEGEDPLVVGRGCASVPGRAAPGAWAVVGVLIACRRRAVRDASTERQCRPFASFPLSGFFGSLPGPLSPLPGSGSGSGWGSGWGSGSG